MRITIKIENNLKQNLNNNNNNQINLIQKFRSNPILINKKLMKLRGQKVQIKKLMIKR